MSLLQTGLWSLVVSGRIPTLGKLLNIFHCSGGDQVTGVESANKISALGKGALESSPAFFPPRGATVRSQQSATRRRFFTRPRLC